MHSSRNKTDDKIRLVIVDDHPISREGLSLGLEKHRPGQFQIVGEASTAYDALELCLKEKPDVLVLDWHLPGTLDGYGLLRLIRQKALKFKILLLTGDDTYTDTFTSPYVPDDYLLKGVPIVLIAERLEKLARAVELNLPYLTQREISILSLVGQAKTDKEIARELNITEGTVGSHMRNIFSKLKVSSRSEALLVAREYELVSSFNSKHQL